MSNPQIPQIALADLPADAVLLDVREAEEWQAGHAPGAHHIPMSELMERLDEVPDASPIYVICRTAGRSGRVTQYLNANGWEAVNVDGGMSVWSGLGRPLESVGGTPPEVI